MKTYLKSDEVKASILLLFFLLFVSTPYVFREITVIRFLYIVGRLLGLVAAAFICFKNKLQWKRFDIIIMLFCAVIFISAFHAGFSKEIAVNSVVSYLHTAYSYVVFILGQLLVIKIMFNTREEVCLAMMKTFYMFYLVLCLLNLVTQILGMEIAARSGNTFILGLDNEIGKYYLFAFFYACVVMVLEDKRPIGRLFFITAITMFESVYRKIGGLFVISFIMAGLVLIFFWAPKWKIWKMRQDILLGVMVTVYIIVMFLFVRLDKLQNFINTYLFGKSNSLTIRFALQTRLLAKWPESPIWGWASILSRIEWGDATWFDYALRGGYTHNYFVETLYNYGVIAFLLYLVVLLLGIKKIRGYDIASFVGLSFFLVLIRGMFENGCQDIFVVLPTVYYLGAWCDRKYSSVRDKVEWKEILN